MFIKTIFLHHLWNFCRSLKKWNRQIKGRAKSALTPDCSLSPTLRIVQLYITQVYHSSKGETAKKLKVDGFSIENGI